MKAAIDVGNPSDHSGTLLHIPGNLFIGVQLMIFQTSIFDAKTNGGYCFIPVINKNNQSCSEAQV
jgi:hypothetical protein